MACHDCLGRTPFASLVATLICCIGVCLFCGTLYRALQITISGIFESLFNIYIPWLQLIQVLFIIIAIAMGCFSIILLVFGFLATGATRENLYSGAKCIMGGRVSAGFFMVLSYILNVLWMGVTSVCAIPILIYVMLRSICQWEITERHPVLLYDYCFNLTRFGIYVNTTDGVTKNALCDPTELGQLCQHVTDAGPMFAMAFAGSLLIVIAMIHFLIGLASNYQRIKMSKELKDYRDAVDLEMTETSVVSSRDKMAFA